MAPEPGPGALPEPEARLKVLAAVLDYPGLHVRAIARLTGLVPSLVEYHAEGLLDAELITEATYAGYRRFYPRPGPGAPTIDDSEPLALLREPIPLHITLLLLNAESPVAHKDIAQHVPIAKSTLSFHLAKLVEARVAEKSEIGYVLIDPDRMGRLVVANRPEPELLSMHFPLWLKLYTRQ